MHLKRLNTPKRWIVEKKSTTFITRQSPGPHPRELSVPLTVLLRNHLGLVETNKEVKRIIHDKLVLVDNNLVKNPKLPVGLFDIISLPSHSLYYRIVLDYKGGIKPLKITQKESEIKLFSILKKTRIKGGKIQLNCTSGRNILLPKNDYSTGDTLIIDLKNKKIINHLKSREGALVLVMKGKHAGEAAIIKGFKNFLSVSKDRAILESEKGKVYETMKEYVFIIGENKNEIRIREEDIKFGKKAEKKEAKPAKKAKKPAVKGGKK